jgi:hypothetical protein
MAYQTTGYEAALTSWGSSNMYSTLLSRIRVRECRLNLSGSAEDISAIASGTYTALSGLRSWTMSVRAMAFSGGVLGNIGFVNLSAGYATHVKSWRATVETTAVHDTTPFRATVGGSAPTWREFRPDSGVRVSGSFTTGVDDATALSLPTAAQGSAPTITLHYGNGATAETLATAAIIQPIGITAAVGGLAQAEHSFTGTGALTTAGTASLLTTGTFAGMPWSAGGSAAGAMVFTLSSGRTWTGTDSFLRSISWTVDVGRPVEVSLEIQGTGAIAPA